MQPMGSFVTFAIGGIILPLLGIFASSGALAIIRRALRGRQEVEDRANEPIIIENYWQRRDRQGTTALRNVAEVITEQVSDENIDFSEIQEAQELPNYSPERPRHRGGPFLAAVLVAVVFGISLAVIWSLMHMGGPVEATVNATISKAGGSILIVGSGLFAAFFAISLIGFVAIRIFSGMFD